MRAIVDVMSVPETPGIFEAAKGRRRRRERLSFGMDATPWLSGGPVAGRR